MNEFVEKAKEADGFIFGSPVYYANASGQISSFWTVPFTAEAPLLPISREQRLPAAAAQEQQQRSIS